MASEAVRSASGHPDVACLSLPEKAGALRLMSEMGLASALASMGLLKGQPVEQQFAVVARDVPTRIAKAFAVYMMTDVPDNPIPKGMAGRSVEIREDVKGLSVVVLTWTARPNL